MHVIGGMGGVLTCCATGVICYTWYCTPAADPDCVTVVVLQYDQHCAT